MDRPPERIFSIVIRLWLIFYGIVCLGCRLSLLHAQEAPNRWQQSKPDLVLRGIEIFSQDRRVEIRGVVNMTSGLIELLATIPGGKEHESIFVLSCNPALLKTAFLLIQVQEGPGPTFPGDPTPLQGDRVDIYITWQNGQTTTRCRAEEVILDQKHGATMPLTGWIFTGSRFGKDPDSGGEIFMANVTGVLVATYRDPDALLNNPLPEGSDDTVYYANPSRLPPRGTPIVMSFLAQ